MNQQHTVKNDHQRIDTYLTTEYPDYSRAYFANLIKDKKILLNNLPTKASQKVKPGDCITIDFIDNKANTCDITAQDIPLNIIYEDQNVLVVNKQAGLTIHPGAGNKEYTLVNALINYLPQIKEAVFEKDNLVSKIRPGIVHRLDKDTTGVIIIAKNPRSMHSLARQIQNRTVKKIYWAICYGWPKNDTGTLVNYLGRHPNNRKIVSDIGQEKGREAISDYKVLDYLKDDLGNKFSMIEFSIKTGRTHQIRVQSKILGYPIMGDPVYSNKESLKLSEKYQIKRQLLHANNLIITLPGDNKPSHFEADRPKDFNDFLNKLQTS